MSHDLQQPIKYMLCFISWKRYYKNSNFLDYLLGWSSWSAPLAIELPSIGMRPQAINAIVHFVYSRSLQEYVIIFT